MPGMTGVELLRRTYDRFPETVRIILTGFADSEATIKAINDRITSYNVCYTKLLRPRQ